MRFTVSLSGSHAVRQAMRSAADRVRSGIKQAVGQTGLEVHAEYRRTVRKRTGGTARRARLEFDNDGMTAEVISDNPYLEFGTMSRGAASDHPPLPDDYRHGSKPGGMPAQPALYPAYRKGAARLEERCAEVLRREAGGGYREAAE